MFDIGLQELIVIFVVALLVFGPKRLPEIGKTLGKGLAEIKKAMEDVKQQVHSEVGDIKDPLDLKKEIYGDKVVSAPATEEKDPYPSSGEGVVSSGDEGAASTPDGETEKRMKSGFESREDTEVRG